MENKIIVGNLLRLRRAKKLTQQEVAVAAGISRVGYRKIESQEALPKVSTLKAIAAALAVDIHELVSPVRQLSHVRFRSQKSLKNREQILAEISDKLEDYAKLENILNLQKDNRLAKIEPAPASGKDPLQVAAQVRKQFNINSEEPIVNICGLLEANGVKVISLRRASNKFFGLSVSAQDGGPAVAVNTWERISVERWIFTAVHELGHLLLHLPAYDVCQIDENLEEEKEANLFASNFLMPQEVFSRAWQNTYGLPFADRVLKIKRIFKVSNKTVLYRLSEKYPGINVWRFFHDSYRLLHKKSLPLREEADAPGAAHHPDSFSEWSRAQEPDDLSPCDFQGERLWLLVRKGIEAGKVSLARGAEILSMPLTQMRQISLSWKAEF